MIVLIQVDVLGAAKHCSSPVLFGHAQNDQLALSRSPLYPES